MEIREGIHLHILLPLYWVKDFDSKIPRPALPFWPCLLYICWVHLSVSPTALTTQSEDAVDPKCHSLPLVGPAPKNLWGNFPRLRKKNKGRNSWNFPRDSLGFLQMGSKHVKLSPMMGQWGADFWDKGLVIKFPLGVGFGVAPPAAETWLVPASAAL